jgi:small subunit ribosomal protein S2
MKTDSVKLKAKSEEKVESDKSPEAEVRQEVKEDGIKNSKQKKDYKLDLTELLEAGVHFGHQARRWHPKMAKYIWQERDGVHIFDLLKTQEYFAKACEAVKKELASGKKIVFVGTKRQAGIIIKAEALRARVSYVNARWAGGAISNWKQVSKSIKRLKELREGLEKGTFDQYTKKERVLMERELNRLERLFGGIAELSAPPQIMFVVDVNREKAAVKEARKSGAKVFALVDSNVNPDSVDYIIPGNDDAVRSINMLVSKFADAVIEGKELRKKGVKVVDKKS